MQTKKTLSAPLRFVFVASLPRSGSTLLAFLLGIHPEIATVSEMTGPSSSKKVNTDQYRCSCGERIKDCVFWNQVRDGMHDRGFDFHLSFFETMIAFGRTKWIRQLLTGSLGSNSLGHRIELLRDNFFHSLPGYESQLQYLVTRNLTLAETILAVTNSQVFLDTSKSYMRIKYLAKYTDIDLRVIHFVRDVRGYVSSVLRTHNNVTVTHVAKRWVKNNEHIRRYLKMLPDSRHILVCYEDLCEDPLGTLHRLHQFCGVDILSELPNLQDVLQHIIGNPMRKSDISEIRADLRWKQELSNKQLEEIHQVSQSSMETYGYSNQL